MVLYVVYTGVGLHQPQGALTFARADADDRKSANRADFTVVYRRKL